MFPKHATCSSVFEFFFSSNIPDPGNTVYVQLVSIIYWMYFSHSHFTLLVNIISFLHEIIRTYNRALFKATCVADATRLLYLSAVVKRLAKIERLCFYLFFFIALSLLTNHKHYISYANGVLVKILLGIGFISSGFFHPYCSSEMRSTSSL